MFFYYDKESLEYRKHSIKTKIYSILGVFGFILILSILIATQLYRERIVTEEARLIILKEQNAFSKTKLKEYIIQLNIKFPHIVLAQSELESQHYTSPIFKENHNLYGMKQARIRPTTNLGTNRGHAIYNNWRESVVDYAMYSATYLNDIKTEEQYYQYLQSYYAEDPNYVPKLRLIVKQNQSD